MYSLLQLQAEYERPTVRALDKIDSLVSGEQTEVSSQSDYRKVYLLSSTSDFCLFAGGQDPAPDIRDHGGYSEADHRVHPAAARVPHPLRRGQDDHL